MSEVPGYSPFRYDLVSANFNITGLETFTEAPDIIIRNNGSYDSSEEAIDHINRFRAALAGLHTYGIEALPAEFVVSHDQRFNRHEPVVYTVCERLNGVSLQNNNGLVPVENYIETLANFIQYYSDVITNGGEYISDLEVQQCMYGTTQRDPNPKTYLVDLDIFLKTWGTTMATDVPEGMYADLNALAHNIDEAEAIYGIDGSDLALQLLRAVNKLPYIAPEDYTFSDPSSAYLASDLLHEILLRHDKDVEG